MSAGRKWLLTVAALISCWGMCFGATSADAGSVPQKKYTEAVAPKTGDKITFDMVLIPGGTFKMGSAAGESGRKDDEGPQHEVRLAPFYLCTTETTIELFLAYYQETVRAKEDFVTSQQAKKNAQQADKGGLDAMSGPTPVYGDMTMGYDKTHPAMGMTWHNASHFCRWLSVKTGKPYRLPTEAEWEYACRAGASGAYGSCGDPEQLGEYAWFEDNSDEETHPVAKKKPNAWGLYDMQGNVREWVHDFYSPTGYKESAAETPAVNPRGPKEGDVHVARGGGYESPGDLLRCAARTFEEPWWRSGDPQIPKSKWWLPEMDFIGFRVACSVGGPTEAKRD